MNILFLALLTSVLKVGALLPLRGSNLSGYGRDCLLGMKMAIDEIEVPTQSGQGIELIVEDNWGDKALCVEKLKELAHKGCEVIIGPLISDNVIGVAKTLSELKIPLLAPAATNVEVTKKSKYIWRLCYTDKFQGELMADFVYNMYNKRNAVIIYEKDNSYSKGLMRYFNDKFKKSGGKIVAIKTYFSRQDYFKKLLEEIKEKHFDCIFVPGYYGEVGLMIKQARESGITAPFIGCDGWDSPRLIDIMGRNGPNYYCTHFSSKDPDVSEFRARYVKRFVLEPSSFSALGYDAIMLISYIRDNFPGQSLENALPKVKGFKGVTGVFNFEKGRAPSKGIVVLKIDGGKISVQQKFITSIKKER